jgi:hypothetical protein
MLRTLWGLVMPLISGGHARLRGAAALRPLCLIALIGLVIEFTLGTILNLYVMIPAADARASYIQEVESAPGFLTAHALVGLLLLGTAGLLLTGAIALRHGTFIALVTTGLAALLGAFTAGEVFVKTRSAAASLWMAILTGVALICYVSLQARLGAAVREAQSAPRVEVSARG